MGIGNAEYLSYYHNKCLLFGKQTGLGYRNLGIEQYTTYATLTTQNFEVQSDYTIQLLVAGL